jgi:hypothetical protein
MTVISEQKKLVAYLIAPIKSHTTILFSSDTLQLQEAALQDFLNSHPEYQLIKTFVELGDAKRQRLKWPELKKATDFCHQNNAHLVLAEIKNLTANESFSSILLEFISDAKSLDAKGLYCCDQPFINAQTLPAVIEHTRIQRNEHGTLIKAGLKRSHAKSGNPHATEEINRVNLSKISHAIIYSLLLHPIIDEYAQNGLSQRKMVEMLNLEGYTAPEGGTWVLSQLQKMLERMKVNQTALLLESRLTQELASGLTEAQIADRLNQEQKIIPPRGKDAWTEDLVSSVYKRSVQIRDILKFNELIIELTPILNQYHIDEITETIFAKAVSEKVDNLVIGR